MYRTARLLSAAFVASLLLVSCVDNGSVQAQNMSVYEKQAVAALQWLDQADASSAVKDAIKRGDFHLYSMGGRGASIPGVPTELAADYAEKCGVEVVPGAGDVVHGDIHIEYLQRAQKYAESYNTLMLEHCTAK